MELVVN